MKSDKRKEQLLRVALELAASSHYQLVSFADIAVRADVSTALVKFYFKNQEQLQLEILRRAVDMEFESVVNQGMLMGEIA